jgi:2-polyprenyl-3-methyl-5-hydroxy-6-metoxy-1,4-benzoquinol methylase
MDQKTQENSQARSAWNTNAPYWDAHMADGNDFFRILIWPAVEKLLRPEPGKRILDVACGNGVASRRLAQCGAAVTAIDFSEELISLARNRNESAQIDYRVLDATCRDELESLGAGTFDGALCNMALMDMSQTRPLMKALTRLLHPHGVFAFSIMHPCFNNPSTIHTGELEDREGEILTTYSVKISRYMSTYTRLGAAIHGQPVAHPYFHRSLSVLLGDAFDAGFVADAFEERSFPADYEGGTTKLSWSGRFSEIPPVLAVRLRLNGKE